MEQGLSGCGGKAERAMRMQQGFAGTLILRASGCQEELRDFGENFVQIGVLLAFSHSPSPVPSLFPRCWGCGTVTHSSPTVLYQSLSTAA